MKQSYRYILLLFLMLGIVFINSNIHWDMKNKKRRFISPDKQVKHFTLGYDEIIADSMWLRLIQDLGICLQRKRPKDAPRTGANRIANCEKGWGFRMLDVITDLAPKFNMAYFSGSTALSVLADDISGASIIFDKAVKQFPYDWGLQYRAATHFLTEVGDEEKAAKLYQLAAKNGAPQWVNTLAARLYTKVGKALFAKRLLIEFIENNKDNKFIKRAEERLAEINQILEEEKSKKN